MRRWFVGIAITSPIETDYDAEPNHWSEPAVLVCAYTWSLRAARSRADLHFHRCSLTRQLHGVAEKL
jgi:hypothetical protein